MMFLLVQYSGLYYAHYGANKGSLSSLAGRCPALNLLPLTGRSKKIVREKCYRIYASKK